MKKTMTRLLAGLLLVCMLATFIVPATFADTEEVSIYIFDQFDLVKDASGGSAFKSGKDLEFHKTSFHDCGKSSKDCLKECFYDAGIINWFVDDYSNGANVLFRGNHRTDMGLRLNNAGTWASIRLKVAEGGNYTIALRSTGVRKADAWIFPAEMLTENKTAADFMTAQYKLNDITYQSANGVIGAVLGENVALSQGEHIIVFQVKADESRFYINELALTRTGDYAQTEPTTAPAVSTDAPETSETTETTEPTQPDLPEGNYWDFQLGNIPGCAVLVEDDNRGYTEKCPCGQKHTVGEHLEGCYSALGWKISGASAQDFSTVSFRAGTGGIRFTPEAKGWVAITLNVTENGLRDVYIKGGSTQGNIDSYLFRGALTEDQVEEKMADMAAVAGNLLGKNITPNTTIGSAEFTSGEYTLVLHCNRSDKARNIYLYGIGLTESTQEPEGPTEPSVPEVPTEPSQPTTPTEPSVPEEPPFVATGDYWNLKVYDILTNIVPEGSKNTPMDDCVCGVKHTVKDHIDSAYSQLGWKFAGASTPDMSVVTIRRGEDLGLRISPEAQGWVAFNLNVTVSGKSDIYAIGRGNQQDSIYGYLFEGALTQEQIAEKMADVSAVSANALGIPVTPATTPAVIGTWDFVPGEYTLVLRNTRADKVRTLHISGIGIETQKAIPAVDSKVYDFNLSANDETLIKKGPTSRYNADGSIRVHQVLSDLYNSGENAWNYETASKDFTDSNASFREGCFRFKSTENFRELNNQWFAFRVKNPGTATYDIRLTTSADSKMVANIYLIPTDSPIVMSQAKIQDAMTQENLLVKGALMEKKGTYYLGEYTFGMEEEYVLVFEFTKGTILHISNIQMTKDGIKADEAIKKDTVYNGYVYDFDMGDSLNGYFTDSKTYMPDVIGQLNTMWNNGTLKWKYHTSSGGDTPSTNFRFYRASGMRIYAKTDAWIAFRIKSPGSGTHTLTMNYAVASTGGTTAVYILPVDTEDVETAMDPKNRVGKVNMYNDGSETIVDGQTAFVGYWDFEAGKEYILVFESYKESPFSATNSYMNISQVIAEKGKIDYTSGAEKVVFPVVVEENAVPVADALSDGLITEIYGHDYYFLPVEGGSTLVYDLDTGELVDKINTGYARTLDMRQDADGVVWIAGSGKYIVRYDPYIKETSKTPGFNTADWMGSYSGAYTICPTPDGMLWFGTYYSGVLGVYDPETMEYRKIGSIYPENVSQLHGMIYHDGFLYVSIHNDTTIAVVKFDLATEQVVGTLDITHMMGDVKYLNNLSVLGDGDFLVGGINSGKTEGFICIDPKTMELYEDHGMFGAVGMRTTEIIDGKQYMVCNGYGLYEYDVATKIFSKTAGFGNDGIGFRSSGNSLVTLNGERCLLTWTTSGGHPRYFNLDAMEYKTWDNLVVHGSGGAAIREVATGLEGDPNLYIGVFNSDQGAIFDTSIGKKVGQFRTGGQGDSYIWYEGKFYAGNYSSTTLNEIYLPEDPTEIPATNEFIQRWRLDHEETGQKRVHELAAGDGYIFAGTIPDTGCYGGSVTVYDIKTGRWFTHRDVVPGLAVTGLEYSDKLLYGATTTSGGTGTTEAKPAGSSAKFFVYDYENRETIAVMDPRDYIKGLSQGEVTLISSFGKDPVVEGRMWAVVSETLICFTFDRETGKFDVQEVISFDKAQYDTSSGGGLWCKNIAFDAERNYLYVSFATYGGFQQIELADMRDQKVKVVSNERLMGDKPQFFAIGADGELYYGNSASLKMLPLNVTEEDWAVAGKVDQMVLDLGEITLESEAAIKTARSAYENLSWRYKALFQNLELLQEAETDLLECKIDTIVLEDVDADTLPQLQEYMDTYASQNARQKKYVKNYAHLVEAYSKAMSLNNARVAEAMQKRMEDLGKKFPLTLEDEPEVLQLQADFDALTGPQRLLIDASALEEAQAQIKVLRAEFVVYVESLIQQIPTEITLEAEPAILAAREAADKLYTNERKNVSYGKLTSAEGKLRTLKAAKAKADPVVAMIDSIGTVWWNDAQAIAEARAAYEALGDTEKTFVTNIGVLVAAEERIVLLQTWTVPVIAGGSAITLLAAILVIFRKKIFKKKKATES